MTKNMKPGDSVWYIDHATGEVRNGTVQFPGDALIRKPVHIFSQGANSGRYSLVDPEKVFGTQEEAMKYANRKGK